MFHSGRGRIVFQTLHYFILGRWLLSQSLLDISYTLRQNLLQEFWILELLVDLCDNAVRQLFLLSLLNLALVSDPAVKYGLGLRGQSSTLLELVSLSFELCGLLKNVSVHRPR